jgi:hypothetical protein
MNFVFIEDEYGRKESIKTGRCDLTTWTQIENIVCQIEKAWTQKQERRIVHQCASLRLILYG